MARYTGPKVKLSRRVGVPIADIPKHTGKELQIPGMHGYRGRRNTEYGVRLIEKQKLRYHYGMLEKQFRNTFEKASNMHGNSGLNFLRLLELRLQTQVYRMGFAKTIEQARQFVSHQHVFVNGKLVDIPSYTCKIGDVISVRDRDASKGIARRNHYEGAPVPVYIEPDIEGMAGKIVTLPEREDFPKFFNEQSVVEFYAR